MRKTAKNCGGIAAVEKNNVFDWHRLFEILLVMYYLTMTSQPFEVFYS